VWICGWYCCSYRCCCHFWIRIYVCPVRSLFFSYSYQAHTSDVAAAVAVAVDVAVAVAVAVDVAVAVAVAVAVDVAVADAVDADVDVDVDVAHGVASAAAFVFASVSAFVFASVSAFAAAAAAADDHFQIGRLCCYDRQYYDDDSDLYYHGYAHDVRARDQFYVFPSLYDGCSPHLCCFLFLH